ncbi:MAG: hypothetical protein ACREBW_01765, partial [Candidatus Micrarchaeaceae archaeon]
ETFPQENSANDSILAAQLRRLLLGRNPSPTFARMLAMLNGAELLELHAKPQQFLQTHRETLLAKRTASKAHVRLVQNRLPNMRYQRGLGHIV